MILIMIGMIYSPLYAKKENKQSFSDFVASIVLFQNKLGKFYCKL